jgi:hypothetical protein
VLTVIKAAWDSDAGVVAPAQRFARLDLEAETLASGRAD